MHCTDGKATAVAPATMNVRLPPGVIYAALLIVVSAWILHSFLQALLAACVTAIASWPLYKRIAAALPPRMGRAAKSLIFTLGMAVFVLGPFIFAFGALLVETRALLLELAAADKTGIVAPAWLAQTPLIGPWAAAGWQSELAHPGALLQWTHRADASALLAWAQSLGQFMIRHVFIIGFATLLLFFFYQQGEALARQFRRLLRARIGERADRYADLATRAVRASVNSMLVVSLFDGFGTGIGYMVAGVPHAPVWGAVTGLLALVPFVGYVAVLALTLQLALTSAAAPPLVAFALGCLVLFCGDKILRPVVARDGMRLPFVWVLMGCLGGFEVLGLVGLVIGPVVLTLVRELWAQRVRDVAVPDLASAAPGVECDG